MAFKCDFTAFSILGNISNGIVELTEWIYYRVV